MGKSFVVRIPAELVQRINNYDNCLKKQGISVSKVDAMRRFAENSITPQEDVKLAARVLGKQPFKFKL